MDLIHSIYEPRGTGPHPTLLALHGRGANALDLLGLAPHVCGGRFRVICPQGTVQTPIGPGAIGYAWFPSAMGGPPQVPAILSARQQVRTFIDACLARYDIERHNLVLLGFSQGGVMGYSLALGDADRFAAFVALSTWLPPELLQHLPATSAWGKLPILIQHGLRDELVAVERARQSVERLRQQRLPLTYREYDMGHEINTRSLLDISTWLDEHVR
jgi:phospholipase/carboxylesterase